MPKFLKDPTIMLLDGGLASYSLGLHGMVMPSLRGPHRPETKYAPVLGLYGAAAELLVKACLVQGKGIGAMYKNGDISSGVYRYGGEVIEDFKKCLQREDERIAYIWGKQTDHLEQKERLISHLNKFRLLQQLRANGLHAGEGCSRDIALVMATEIYSFIQLLSQSKRLRPYLRNVSAPEIAVRDREAIIEDLARRFHSSKNCSEKTALLRNMYLVLPYIPEIRPDWVDAFEKIAAVPPSDRDLSYLSKTLTDAHSIYLLKNRGGKDGIPVRIEPKNPDALPIAIQNIKRTLNTIPDKFNNDVMTANTRLEEHRLDLPIEDFLVDLYTIGLEETHIQSAGQKLTAQQVWPFVATAYSSSGTPRPCWFLIRNCDEIDQLISYMQRAEKCGNGYLKRRISGVLAALYAMKNHTDINWGNTKDKIFKEIEPYKIKISTLSVTQPELFTPLFLKKYPLSSEVSAIVQEFVTGNINAGKALSQILELDTLDDAGKKAALMLLPLCYNSENKNGLISVFHTKHLQGYVSRARKMMFFSDFIENGPKSG